MPLQLVFTSAPQGLAPGRSGFCTVARHRAMPDRLAQLLEAAGTPHDGAEGATYTFRQVEAGGRSWCVLSRFVARGLDYTQRDNRLAHHVAFTLEEAAVLPPPAALALRWKGWHDEWSGAPAWLEEDDRPLRLEAGAPLTPAVAWREETGTGAKAAWLVGPSGPAAVGLVRPPETARLLRLFAESSALLGRSAWAASFTTDARVTGADGFLWAAHAASASKVIDFAVAKDEPAPTGEFARHAAAGTNLPKSPAGAAARPVAVVSGRGLPWIVGGLLAIVLVAGAVMLLRREPPPPPAPVVEVKAPPVIDTQKADEILKANRALAEVQSLLEADDFVGAAKLWTETSSLSPTFARNYREQVMPRLLAQFSASATRQVLQRLERPNVLHDPKSIREAIAEAREAQRLGAELGVPQDDAWKKLVALQPRAEALTSIDVRPTLLIPGEWKTAESGANAPSQADFPLSRAAGDAIAKFVEASGATMQASVQARIRLLPLETPHFRDDRTPYLPAEIRRTPQATWIESSPEPGKLPAIGIGLKSRGNAVALNFPTGEGARDLGNRLIEVSLPNGERQCFALLGDLRRFRPLNLGADALVLDPDTGVIRAASWAEGAVNALVWVNGSVGLYPDGHEFPDRDLPSVRATRSVLETDLIRLEAKQGPSAPPYESIAARRRLFKDGKLLQAGAPWTVQAIDVQGTAGPRLIEFR